MIELTITDKKSLLSLARTAIERSIKRESAPEHDAQMMSPALQQHAGVFVTLHKQEHLRGCIGTFTADRPLWEQVKRMARSAAFEDSRFSPVRAFELPELDLEISVLSPLQEIQSIEQIEVGKHGLYLTRGFHRGVLLPQVATEHGWDRLSFLEHTCLKAGLPPDAWQKGTTIEIFSAVIFNEKDPEFRHNSA
ncbi:AmmeMemoRadiSam system protein A [bacterium]|nr:AmmeMemoRadiSam system protein A [bacterium]